MKIVTVLGTRPEIIKMSAVIEKLDMFYNHVLVHTGQNYDYELNKVFFDDLGVREPDHYLDAAGESVIQTIANILLKVDKILELENPDAFLVYGDTNSCLSVVAAKRRKIPIFHFEAGNRCFDLRVPEEINRKIVDHTADINFVLSEHARTYLQNEGISTSRIFKTGSHMHEVIMKHIEKIYGSTIMDRLTINKNEYCLISLHREENVDDKLKLQKIINSLQNVSEYFHKKILVSTHPRTKKSLEKLGLIDNENIVYMPPFGFFDYCKLQQQSFCVISDSGTITEESSILKFPAVMLREMHERPEGVDAAAVPMGSLDFESLCLAIKLTVETEPMSTVADYSNERVSDMVVRNICGYVSYINREVWKK